MFNFPWQKKSSPSVGTKSTNPYSDSSFFGRNLFGGNKYAGVTVNYTTAMRHQDVYSCIRIKSESLGQIPVCLYRQQNDENIKVTSGREHKIFTQTPNEYQTWQEFIEQYVTTIETQGNFYAHIKRNVHGNVYELVPFKYQENCSVEMDAEGTVYYTYSTNDGKTGIYSKKSYIGYEILHLKLQTRDGFRGLSPITQTAQAIGSAIAGDTLTSSLFENGATPQGVLSTDQSFGEDEEAEESIQRLKKQWNELYQGPANSGKTAVLEFGMQYQQIQMSAVDTQLIEQRKYSREQIASIFRVPLHMLGSPDGMKYNTVEQTATNFFRDSLMPLVTRLENNINLLLPANHIIKLDEREFIRGDRKAQIDNVDKEIKMGVRSINSGAKELGLPTIDGGEVYAISTNNVTYGTWDQQKLITDATIAKMVSDAEPTPNPKPTSKE